MAKKNKEESLKEEVVQNEQAEEAVCDAQNEKVAALEDELAKTKDQLLRTAAEYDNFRRRSQKEKEALYTDSKADVLTKLLPVIDNFERASAAQGDLDSYIVSNQYNRIEFSTVTAKALILSCRSLTTGALGVYRFKAYMPEIEHVEDVIAAVKSGDAPVLPEKVIGISKEGDRIPLNVVWFTKNLDTSAVK